MLLTIHTADSLTGTSMSTPPTVARAAPELNPNRLIAAAMADVARTTVNAVLRKLQTSGLVELSYRSVRVLAPDALRSMLEV